MFGGGGGGGGTKVKVTRKSFAQDQTWLVFRVSLGLKLNLSQLCFRPAY